MYQFIKLITDHTHVTYKIKEEKLLFLLCDVREFSNLSSYDFNLSAFVKLPTVELSPNMLVLQNICKSPELTLPAVTINGQTKGKPKPHKVFMMQ